MPAVVAVAKSPEYSFSKSAVDSVTLIEGIGVDGDVHSGRTVKHRVRLRRDPESPNLRQVHLLAAEFLDELNAQGFGVGPGDLGENVTTRGLDLIRLPTGTRLRLGGQAVVEVTGLRDPCNQLNGLRPGLMKATLERDTTGGLIRKAGVMAIVVSGGVVRGGDPILVTLPEAPHRALQPV